MLNLGLAVLLAACAFLLSTLQEWALRGTVPLVRHLVAWLAGTLLVSAVVTFAWRLVATPAGASPGAAAPALGDSVTTVLHWIVALGVAAALAAGALHARQVDDDAHESAHDRWVGRAVVQGVALFVVGFGGFFVLLLTAIGQIR